MDQTEYEERERRRRERRPWTPLQIAVLILALLLAAPFVLCALFTVVWVVNRLAESQLAPARPTGHTADMEPEREDDADPGLAATRPGPSFRAFLGVAGTVLWICLALALPTLCIWPVARLCVSF